MTGTPMTLGQDMTIVFSPTFVSSGVQPFTYSVPAGSFLALAVIAGSISKTIMDQTSAAVQSAGAAFASDNATAICQHHRRRCFWKYISVGTIGVFFRIYRRRLRGRSKAGGLP
jgi:hypothetical protein